MGSRSVDWWSRNNDTKLRRQWQSAKHGAWSRVRLSAHSNGGQASRRATTQYPSGRKYSSGYTGRGEPRTFYDITSGPTTAFQAYYIYDPSGNLTTRNINQYQTHTNSTYDALNRPTQAQHFLVGSSPKFNYGYDEMSNRKYEQRDGMLADGFGYDVNNQLNSFRRDGTLSGSSVSGGALSTLVYDANGNRRSVVESGVTTTYAAANNLNQYPTVGGLGATYDGNGNLKTYSGWTYTYDAMNRLTAASKTGASATFHYDGLNRQITRNFNGNGLVYFSVWDGWDLVEEYTQGNALYASYLHGAKSDELISMTRSGQAYYFFQDGRGNTSQVANSSGALVETCKYDVHGEAAITVAPGKTATGNRFLFTGREYYQPLGLYNYRNRFYSPDIGRFLQPDPIGFKGDPANLYRYCGNNSVNWSDPYGLDITVVEYPASLGPVDYNHVGYTVTGWSGTRGYYPSFRSPVAPGVVKADAETPITGRSVTIPTTIEQDGAAEAYADAVAADPGTYTVWDDNCSRFVEGALKAAGVANVPTPVAPGSLINKLKKQYDMGPFADVHVTLRTGGGGNGGTMSPGSFLGEWGPSVNEIFDHIIGDPGFEIIYGGGGGGGPTRITYPILKEE